MDAAMSVAVLHWMEGKKDRYDERRSTELVVNKLHGRESRLQVFKTTIGRSGSRAKT